MNKNNIYTFLKTCYGALCFGVVYFAAGLFILSILNSIFNFIS